MRIEPVGNGPTFKSITIKAKQNKECQYLYNKVLDMVREEKVPAVFHPYHIIIDSDKPSLKERLSSMAIKWLENVKKSNK